MLYTVLENALPTGQAVLLSDSEHTPPLWQFAVYSGCMTLLTSAAGLALFRRKDLK